MYVYNYVLLQKKVNVYVWGGVLWAVPCLQAARDLARKREAHIDAADQDGAESQGGVSGRGPG